MPRTAHAILNPQKMIAQINVMIMQVKITSAEFPAKSFNSLSKVLIFYIDLDTILTRLSG